MIHGERLMMRINIIRNKKFVNNFATKRGHLTKDTFHTNRVAILELQYVGIKTHSYKISLFSYSEYRNT